MANRDYHNRLFEIYGELIAKLEEITGFDNQLLLSKVILQPCNEHYQDTTTPTTHYPIFQLYNRLPLVINDTTIVYGPVFSMENLQNEAKLSISKPKLGASLLIFEPDRIIHINYAKKGDIYIVLWADGVGEFEHLKMYDVSSHSKLVHFIVEETAKIFPPHGFSVRLAIDLVTGWSSNDLLGIAFLT